VTFVLFVVKFLLLFGSGFAALSPSWRLLTLTAAPADDIPLRAKTIFFEGARHEPASD
jgi:hypothetical protein